jgi:hypothetical protein
LGAKVMGWPEAFTAVGISLSYAVIGYAMFRYR